MKRTALVGLKVAVSLALLAYLFSVTDTHALEERVRSADLLMLVAAVACYLAMLALATWRWRLLLETLGVDAPMRQLLSSYLVATFFNNFLPSNIGGDVVRVRDGSRLTGSTAASLAVVGIDRILGFGALYVLAATAFAAGRAGRARARGSARGARRLRDRVSRAQPTSSSGPARRGRCSPRRGSTGFPGRSRSSRRPREP